MATVPFSSDAFPFITISRQTGAGGRLLAKTILSEMKKDPDQNLFGGWRLFDAEMFKGRPEGSVPRATLSWLKSENYRREFEDIFYQLLTYQEPQLDVLGRLFKAIYQAAERGKVIIVGRGAGILCRSLPLGLRVRLVAPMENRIHRMSALSTIGRKKAEREILRRDRSRTWFVQHYLSSDIQDPLLYQTVFNTAQVPLKDIARLLIRQIALQTDRQARSI